MVPFKTKGTVSYVHFIATMDISLAVSKIFSMKEWREVGVWVRSHSRSSKMAQFDRPYATFCWSVIVSIAVSSSTIFKLFDIE